MHCDYVMCYLYFRGFGINIHTKRAKKKIAYFAGHASLFNEGCTCVAKAWKMKKRKVINIGRMNNTCLAHRARAIAMRDNIVLAGVVLQPVGMHRTGEVPSKLAQVKIGPCWHSFL